MPVKRRVDKRRIDPAAEAEAWAEVFTSGHDYFGDLRDYGVELDAYDRAPDEIVRAAWQRLGPIYLASRKPDAALTPWALTTFGEPTCP